MAVTVPSISCCVLNHHILFYQIENALAFNRDTCWHLTLCLRLLPFNWGLGALKVRNDERYKNDPQPVILIVIMMRATMAIVILPKMIMIMHSVDMLCD